MEAGSPGGRWPAFPGVASDPLWGKTRSCGCRRGQICHSSDVWGAGQSVVEDYAQVPFRRRRRSRDILDSGWQVHLRAVFPRDEEAFSFIKVEFEVMRSCPSGWCAEHSEMRVAAWVLEEDGGWERNSWVSSYRDKRRDPSFQKAGLGRGAIPRDL